MPMRIPLDAWGVDRGPAYSPDGTRIASVGDETGSEEIYLHDASGKNRVQLTKLNRPRMGRVLWSPDGKWIAFVKRENAGDKSANQSADSLISNIYLVNVQSGEIKQITSFPGGRAETAHWSPDGNTLAFNTVLDGRMEVQIADIASGEIRSLTSEPGCCPAWMRK